MNIGYQSFLTMKLEVMHCWLSCVISTLVLICVKREVITTLIVWLTAWKRLSCLLLVVIIHRTLMPLTSFILEMFYIKMVILHWCMFLENKICVQILWLSRNHIQGAMFIGTVPPDMEALILRDKFENWFQLFFFHFVLPCYFVTPKKKKNHIFHYSSISSEIIEIFFKKSI